MADELKIRFLINVQHLSKNCVTILEETTKTYPDLNELDLMPVNNLRGAIYSNVPMDRYYDIIERMCRPLLLREQCSKSDTSAVVLFTSTSGECQCRTRTSNNILYYFRVSIYYSLILFKETRSNIRPQNQSCPRTS